MSSDLKPIKVYGKAGPNPPKVAMILRLLDIPHEIESISFEDLKKESFLSINPNGRMPAIQDPNNDDLVLWESGAIIEYLVERYDTKNKLSFPAGSKEAALAKQWLYFQVSGQGPYYGQSIWFERYHQEKLPSALERYIKEVARVTGVLETHLAKQPAGQDGPWLVGGKMSYADVSFTPWQSIVQSVWGGKEPGYKPEDYPHVKAWMDKMSAKEEISTGLKAMFGGH